MEAIANRDLDAIAAPMARCVPRLSSCIREGDSGSTLGASEIKSQIAAKYAVNREVSVTNETVSENHLSQLLFAKHGELRGAIHCAQGLFEANFDCLGNVMRLQRENANLRRSLEHERVAFKGRELALLELVRGQQRTIASMQQMVAIGAVWSKLINPTHFGTFEDPIVDTEASRLAEAASMVLAWLSVCCVRQAASAAAPGDERNRSNFSIDIFARQVADALASAESEIVRLSGLLAVADQERRQCETAASDAAREIHALRTAVADIESAHSSCESVRSGLEAEVRWLERDLEAAQAAALRWREECEQMSRTLRTLVDRSEVDFSSVEQPKALGTPLFTSASHSPSSSPDASITPLPRYVRAPPVVASASRHGRTLTASTSPLGVTRLDTSSPHLEGELMQQAPSSRRLGLSNAPIAKTHASLISKISYEQELSSPTDITYNAETNCIPKPLAIAPS